jgi:predicted kinase
MSKLQVLVGMIASGKSTYCKHAAKRGTIIINDDAIVTMVHGGFYKLYKKDLKPLYKSVENHIASTALAMGKNVVVDRGLNTSHWSRMRWIGISHSMDAIAEAVVFKREAPEVHARRRFLADARGYSYEEWLTCAIKHDAVWEEPNTQHEGFDIVKYITWEDIQQGVIL